MPPSRLVLEGPTPIELDESWLFVGIDESGHEEFADPADDVFGLGGCATLVRDYASQLRTPWMAMKAEYFGGADTPMHAADLRKPTEVQMEALASFFRTQPFYRLASLVTTRTDLSDDIHPYDAAARVLEQQLRDITKRLGHPRVALVVEDSARTGGLASAFLRGSTLHPVPNSGRSYAIPFVYRWMTKAPQEPLLEVADFVIHTAAAELRTRLKSPGARRRDFEAVFGCHPRERAKHSVLLRSHQGGAL